VILLGIDPGASGGIGIYEHGVLRAEKMPATERDTWDLFDRLTFDRHPIHAALEKVHAMPKQGVSSTFKFGQSYGFLRACLVAAGIPFVDVTPGVWQKALGCLSKGDKNVTKARAQQWFPHIKITHATADALLICEWLRRSRQDDPSP